MEIVTGTQRGLKHLSLCEEAQAASQRGHVGRKTAYRSSYAQLVSGDSSQQGKHGICVHHQGHVQAHPPGRTMSTPSLSYSVTLTPVEYGFQGSPPRILLDGKVI